MLSLSEVCGPVHHHCLDGTMHVSLLVVPGCSSFDHARCVCVCVVWQAVQAAAAGQEGAGGADSEPQAHVGGRH